MRSYTGIYRALRLFKNKDNIMTNDENKKIISTIHERDLEDLFNKFHIKEAFIKGKMKCKFCRCPINKTNLYSIFLEAGDVKLVCDQSECINDMMIYVENKKKNKVNS